MQFYTEFLDNIKEWKDLCLQKKQRKMTHSYMLISKDKELLDIFSHALCSLILCEEGVLCNSCSNCTKAIAKTHPDIFIYPKDDSIKKDDINDIRDHINYKPFEAGSKIFLLKDFSTANDISQNKLLKSLENPPDNTYFILCVDNEIPVLPTIFSRCKKIYLPALTNQDIINYLKLSNITCDENKISYISEGRLDRAINFAKNVAYMQNYDLVVDVLMKLNKSSNMLPLASALYQKTNNLEELLQILESILADVLYVRLNKKDLITNKNIITQVEHLAEEYSADAIDLIIKKIYEIRKQIDFNCSKNNLIDNLLLYMLEVKYLCK